MAIKLVTRVFEKVQLAKRALREITLLRHFANHENITGLIDVDAVSPDFNEMYVIDLLPVYDSASLTAFPATYLWRYESSSRRETRSDAIFAVITSLWKVRNINFKELFSAKLTLHYS